QESAMRRTILVLPVFSLLLGCAPQTHDTRVTTHEGILGGVDDPGDPAVVVLRMTSGAGGRSGCSAKVIGPPVLRTAALRPRRGTAPRPARRARNPTRRPGAICSMRAGPDGWTPRASRRTPRGSAEATRTTSRS